MSWLKNSLPSWLTQVNGKLALAAGLELRARGLDSSLGLVSSWADGQPNRAVDKMTPCDVIGKVFYLIEDNTK